MSAVIKEIRPGFVAEVLGVEIGQPVAAEDVATIQRGIDEHVVLVFRSELISDEQQIEFSRNFGTLARGTEYVRDPNKRRLNAEMTDASNIGEDNQVLGAGDRRRMNNLGSRRWHTDGSYKRYSGKYSLLSARSEVSHGGETQIADMRGGYDALPDKLRELIADLIVEHNIFRSRAVVGFDGFSEEEQTSLPPARHPLVRMHPASGRKSLYLSSHASHIVGWPKPEGMDLLYELTDWATQPDNVYSHRWRLGDLVMWDNRFTMHRGRRHYPESEPRAMHRTTIQEAVPTLEQVA